MSFLFCFFGLFYSLYLFLIFSWYFFCSFPFSLFFFIPFSLRSFFSFFSWFLERAMDLRLARRGPAVV